MPRPRVVARLDGLRDVPLVMVVAPAGYGKSTGLAEWQAADNRATGWLALDERDADPAVLLGYIALALDRAIGLPAGVFEALRVKSGSAWASAIPTLAAALAAAPHPFALVIDDAEVATEAALDIIVSLARNLRAGSQIVLGTRTARAVPVPRLLASGLLGLIEREDLILDDAEAGEVLVRAGARLDADEVHRVNQAAEGWVAGVYLAALSLRSGTLPGPHGTPIPVTGQRLVAEYLRWEILARLPGDDVRFLVRTAILERLNPSLCDAVLQTTGSGDRLAEIERSNLFLIALDAHGEWYRWHGMFRELLLAEFTKAAPDLAREVNRRAADWYEAAGETETALQYAFAASDGDRVGRLLPSVGEVAFEGGRIETLRRWYDWYEANADPRENVAATTVGAMLFAFAGDAVRADRLAELAADSPDPDDAGAAARGLMEALLCRN
ncbi:MAG: hypothetical protein ACJ761_00110, partial [Chloroflexota bacterium]